jgi:hypothetical protein
MNAIHFSPAVFAGARDEELLHNVEEHKYFINQTIPFEVSLDDAFESWNMLVSGPLTEAIAEAGLNHAFPEISKGELFLRVSRHWYFLKKGDTVEVTAKEAVLDYASRFAPNALTRFGYFLKKIAA